MKTCAVILAAGDGKRLKSDIPKYLQKVGGWSLLTHGIENAIASGVDEIYLVMGEGDRKNIDTGRIYVVEQKKKRGTADAFYIALKSIPAKYKNILLFYVDIPLIKPETLKKLIFNHEKNNANITILTTNLLKPKGYGRIIRDNKGGISEIKEDDLLNAEEKKIKEVNLGVYVFKRSQLLMANLSCIKPKGKKREKYLTEIVPFYYGKGLKISSLKLKDAQEGLGINSRMHLVEANSIIFKRNALHHINKMVTVMAPENTYIEKNVKIGRDSIIYPFVYIEAGVKIGKNCVIGPSAHIRSGSILDDNVSIGNFVEISRSHVASGTKIRHFSYIGDTTIGKNVNIGAGCVTANYDGKHKNKITIEDDAFIGSNTTVIAPVKIGKSAITGAGSVVTKNNDIDAYEVVVGVPAKTIRRRKHG
ncbi:MAG: NTP transferase domain-containing protein [Candidatus Saelkia tenebricola]|nr:NTP transferase domain-containing protein [Candidatus Saelkia tenebricola]